MNAGGLLCQNCSRGQTNVISLSPEGIGLLLELAGNSQEKLDVDAMRVSEAKNNSSFELPNNQHETQEVRQLMNQYITHLLGFPPRLHKFLKNL